MAHRQRPEPSSQATAGRRRTRLGGRRCGGRVWKVSLVVSPSRDALGQATPAPPHPTRNSRKSAALLKSQNLVHLDWATLLKSGFGARGHFRGLPEMAVSARPTDRMKQRSCQSLPRRSTPPRGRPWSRNSFTQNGLHLNVRLALAVRVLATRSRKVSFWPICPEGRRSG